jgi:hypothetical protein
MRERRSTLLPSVLTLTVVALLVTPALALAGSGLPATVTISPQRAGPGERVEVTGLDFAPGQTVELTLTTTAGSVPLGSVAPEAGGFFRQLVMLPADVAPGFWELRATAPDGTVAVHIYETAGALPEAATAAAASTSVEAGGTSGADLLVLLIVLGIIVGVGGAVAFVWYHVHRKDQHPGMSAGDDPIWGGAPGDS